MAAEFSPNVIIPNVSPWSSVESIFSVENPLSDELVNVYELGSTVILSRLRLSDVDFINFSVDEVTASSRVDGVILPQINENVPLDITVLVEDCADLGSRVRVTSIVEGLKNKK